MGAKVMNIVDVLPSYYDMKYAILGNFSLSTKEDKYVTREDIVSHNGKEETPPYHFRKAMEIGEYSKRSSLVCHPYPYYAVSGRWGYCFYIDIRKAYLQIARRFGSDVHYKVGGGIGYGEYTFDDQIFSDNKIVRGMLVSGTQSEIKQTVWFDGNYHQNKHHNSLHAPYLRASIMNTLQAIAFVCKRYCVYWHTDGCIVPSIYLDKLTKMLDTHSFQWAIKKEGYTEIFGIGSYTIGDYTTLTPKVVQGRKDGIIEDNPLWYLVKFAKSPHGDKQI